MGDRDDASATRRAAIAIPAVAWLVVALGVLVGAPHTSAMGRLLLVAVIGVVMGVFSWLALVVANR